MIILYLIRHGETVDNAAQILQGHLQGELNETGIKQAEEVRDLLVDEDIDVFVASDLKRSVDTCRIIARTHCKKVVTTPLLRERDWGDFTGAFIPDLKNKTWPENIESIEQLKLRAQDFLVYIKANYPNKKVLAVGHGIINKAIQSVYFKIPMNEVQKMTNAEVRRLKL